MQQILEHEPITKILEVADKKTFINGYQGVVVESGSPASFEGTLIYVPGIHAKELSL